MTAGEDFYQDETNGEVHKMEKKQKTTAEWEADWNSGDLTVRDLWNAGFRPRSNKYRSALKEYKYYKKYYSISLTLSHDDYDMLKECGLDVMREEHEAAERDEYDRMVYLQNKFGD